MEHPLWTDGDALFLRCNLWGPYAENAVETLGKGMQVVAVGRLKQRSYETREGDKRTVFELDVDDIGPTLRFAIAKVTKTIRTGGQGGPQGQTGAVQRGAGPATADPWAMASTGATAGEGGGWDPHSEPPF